MRYRVMHDGHSIQYRSLSVTDISKSPRGVKTDGKSRAQSGRFASISPHVFQAEPPVSLPAVLAEPWPLLPRDRKKGESVRSVPGDCTVVIDVSSDREKRRTRSKVVQLLDRRCRC